MSYDQISKQRLLVYPTSGSRIFFRFFFENLIKNTYYWLDQGKKVKSANNNVKGVFLGFFLVWPYKSPQLLQGGYTEFFLNL